jgi:hypothetical protein
MDEELAFPGTDDGRTVAEVDAYIKAENTAWPEESGRVLTLADSVADLEVEASPLTDDELADCGLLSELTTDEEPTAPAPVALTPAQQYADELLQALTHLHHNARASGAEMGLALDVAGELIAKVEATGQVGGA